MSASIAALGDGACCVCADEAALITAPFATDPAGAADRVCLQITHAYGSALVHLSADEARAVARMLDYQADTLADAAVPQ